MRRQSNISIGFKGEVALQSLKVCPSFLVMQLPVPILQSKTEWLVCGLFLIYNAVDVTRTEIKKMIRIVAFILVFFFYKRKGFLIELI